MHKQRTRLEVAVAHAVLVAILHTLDELPEVEARRVFAKAVAIRKRNIMLASSSSLHPGAASSVPALAHDLVKELAARD